MTTFSDEVGKHDAMNALRDAEAFYLVTIRGGHTHEVGVVGEHGNVKLLDEVLTSIATYLDRNGGPVLSVNGVPVPPRPRS